MENDYVRFKHLLEYFVVHLGYCNTADTTLKGYSEYIEPLEQRGVFKKSGQGYKEQGIQKQINGWSEYKGNTIYINIVSYNYTNKSNYLNWADTSYNIIAKWSEDKSTIEGLRYVYQTLADDNSITNTEDLCDSMSVTELGLFDNLPPNNALKKFYINCYIGYNDDLHFQLLKNYMTEKYCGLLTKSKNLILTGAPGTGKTHLAKEIATMMNAETEFVQFHPSYDYTDFVEGLRPIKGRDDADKIGFELRDGTFKEFCKKAIKAGRVDGVDNFEEAWQKLVEYLEENESVSIKLISGKKSIDVELNEFGTGLAQRTYPDAEVDGNSKHWISGKSKFFSKDQLYNVYRGRPGVNSGGHDNYRKAVVAHMKKHFGLQNYKEGIELNDEKKPPFVFIIDEINRGEINKIFGELFFSIDPGYRGIKGAVKTQYANLQDEPNEFDEALRDALKKNPSQERIPEGYGHFFVPDNVYIIGTMNDIDRSVESMDFAFRRRFAFYEVKANESMENILAAKDDKDNYVLSEDLRKKAADRMMRLNAAIEEVESLSSAYHIGASYFLKLKDLDNDFEQLWDYYLEGVLKEYLRGMPDAQGKLANLKKAYDNTLEEKPDNQGNTDEQ